MGRNYLLVADGASGESCEGAQEAARAIRSIISGERASYWQEYPCHSPWERRWYAMWVTRFEDRAGVRVVVSHENVTERKLAEQALREARDVSEAARHEAEALRSEEEYRRREAERRRQIAESLRDVLAILNSTRSLQEVLDHIEMYYPGFRQHIKVMEIATPSTVERFAMKNWGCVGGPKQAIGQEMLNRPHARSDWKNLYLCGDSTVMGIGVVAATASGIGAANMVLKDLGMPQFAPKRFPRQYINFVQGRPWTPVPDPAEPITDTSARRLAGECQLCEHPGCMKACPAGVDVPGFLRRIEAGNYIGAVQSLRQMNPLAEICGYLCDAGKLCEKHCNRLDFSDTPTRIKNLQRWVCGQVPGDRGRGASDSTNGKLRVAIVGAGPAGLSCAYFLSLAGCRVTIHERSEKAGGNFAHRMNEQQLPRRVLRKEIEGMGNDRITIQYRSELGKHVQLDVLAREFDAVFLSTGTAEQRNAEDPGIDQPAIRPIDQTVAPGFSEYLRKALGRQSLEVDPETLKIKGSENVFAGGDMIRGSRTVAQAVADGRRAAKGIADSIL